MSTREYTDNTCTGPTFFPCSTTQHYLVRGKHCTAIQAFCKNRQTQVQEKVLHYCCPGRASTVERHRERLPASIDLWGCQSLFFSETLHMTGDITVLAFPSAIHNRGGCYMYVVRARTCQTLTQTHGRVHNYLGLPAFGKTRSVIYLMNWLASPKL